MFSPGYGYNGCRPNYLIHSRVFAIFLYRSARLKLLQPPNTFRNRALLFSNHVFLIPSVGSVTTRAIFFFLRLLPQALPRLVYTPRHLVFQPRIPQALPRLSYNQRNLVLLPRLPQALPRLRLQRPQP